MYSSALDLTTAIILLTRTCTCILQVFYYTDVKFRAKKEKDKESYYVLSSHLPPMISSVESKLGTVHVYMLMACLHCVWMDECPNVCLSVSLSLSLSTHIQMYSLIASHVSQLPSLNFLVYIPKMSEYPLHIRQSSKSSDSTDTFLVAQWGGVMIYNPPEIARQRENKSKDDNRTNLLDSKGALKVAVKMEEVIPVFIQQLKMLLGVSSNEWVCT